MHNPCYYNSVSRWESAPLPCEAPAFSIDVEKIARSFRFWQVCSLCSIYARLQELLPICGKVNNFSRVDSNYEPKVPRFCVCAMAKSTLRSSKKDLKKRGQLSWQSRKEAKWQRRKWHWHKEKLWSFGFKSPDLVQQLQFLERHEHSLNLNWGIIITF